MSLNAGEIITQMSTAAAKVFASKWGDVANYAQSEFEKFVNSLDMIEDMVNKKEISEERAKSHIQMQRNSMRNVFIAVEGIGILMAEEAINAAIGVIRDAVNKAIGFTLL